MKNWARQACDTYHGKRVRDCFRPCVSGSIRQGGFAIMLLYVLCLLHIVETIL
jgi:hypothetical protein